MHPPVYSGVEIMPIRNKLVLTPSKLALLNGPKAIRQWLGISQAEMGDLLRAHDQVGRSGRQFRRSTISIWENPRPGARWQMGADVPELYAAVVSDAIEGQSHQRITTRATLGKRRWRFEALGVCKVCARRFKIDRINQTKCGRHKQ